MFKTRYLSSIVDSAVRVRYAPSPTGSLHLGGLRTALFNYLFARHHGGSFLLRVEDTDQARLVPGSMDALLRALHLCGIEHDEGPGRDSPVGPFVQSQRLPLYAAHAAELLENRRAYRCFCSEERLVKLKEEQALRGLPTVYDRACSVLPREESAARARGGETFVVRLHVPPGSTQMEDAVVGNVTFPHASVDDTVLLKSSGWPTYHLANVVDDHLMGISHVIRGQEWLPSTPKHRLLYHALGWRPPIFAHLPLLLSPDRSKLSKRKGDASVEDFLTAGFLPGALVNFVALLGWAPKAGSPPLSPTATLDELSRVFSLDGVGRANAIVDRSRLEWVNAQYVKTYVEEWKLKQGSVAGGAVVATPDDVGKERGGAHQEGASCGGDLDTPSMKTLREFINGPLLSALEPFTNEKCDVPGPTSRFNSLLAAQCERIGSLSDAVPLLLPFFLQVETHGGENSYLKYLQSPSALDALSRVHSALLTSKGISGNTRKGVVTQTPPAVDHATIVDPNAATATIPIARLSDFKPLLSAVTESLSLEPSDEGWEVWASGKIKGCAKEAGVPVGKCLLFLRWILTGMDSGPSFSQVLGFLGKKECLLRLRAAETELAKSSAGGS